MRKLLISAMLTVSLCSSASAGWITRGDPPQYGSYGYDLNTCASGAMVYRHQAWTSCETRWNNGYSDYFGDWGSNCNNWWSYPGQVGYEQWKCM